MEQTTEEELIVDPRFNIFDKSVSDQSVIACNNIEYHPISQVSPTSTVIEFCVSGDGDQYVDTNNIQLRLSGRVKNTDGSPADAKDGICCNLFHSIFSQVDVSYNDRLLTESTNNYPYLAYIRTLTESTAAQKNSKLQAQMYFPETNGEIDQNTETSNKALAKRMFYSKGGSLLEMVAPLLVDVFSTKTFLIPGVSMRIKLYMNRPAFYIVTPNRSAKSAFIIESAVLIVPKLSINPQLILSHLDMLKQQPAMYRFHKYATRVHTIPKESRNVNIENLFSDKVPSLVIVALIASVDFSGSYATNPYNFQHFKIRSIGLVLNGQNVPGNSQVADFSDDDKTNAGLFKTFTDAVEKHFGNLDPGIDLKDYHKGYTLFTFDLSDSAVKTRSGELRLRAEFSVGLPSAVNMLILGRFPAKIYINESRVVSYDMF